MINGVKVYNENESKQEDPTSSRIPWKHHLSSEERGGGRRKREESEIICVFEAQRMSEKDVW